MSALEVVIYVVATGLVLAYLVPSVIRSEFGIIVGFLDIGFLLGCCVYPLALGFELIRPGPEGTAALLALGRPGLSEALHVLFIAVGLCAGFTWGRRASPRTVSAYAEFASRSIRKEVITWRALVLWGLVMYGAFIYIAGFETALVNAAAGRGEDFEGFGAARPWLFLKTLGACGTYAVVFVPALLKARKERFFLVLYIALVVFGYLNSVSRTMLITCTVVPMVIYLRASLRARPMRTMVTGFVIAGIGLLIILFGKDFGQAVKLFVSGDSVSSVGAQHYEGSVLEALLRQFEYQWFSIRAGIHSFTTSGPILPEDLPLSLIGFVPSVIMQWLGLGAFRYNEVDHRFMCINTAHFGLPDCTVPALFSGYSAYLAPVVAGLVFGCLRNFMLGRAEAAWRYIAARDYSKTWLPYLVAILVTNVFSFIPNLIASTSLIIVVAGSCLAVKAISRGRGSHRERRRLGAAPVR